jgi:hypothetical protein
MGHQALERRVQHFLIVRKIQISLARGSKNRSPVGDGESGEVSLRGLTDARQISEFGVYIIEEVRHKSGGSDGLGLATRTISTYRKSGRLFILRVIACGCLLQLS